MTDEAWLHFSEHVGLQTTGVSTQKILTICKISDQCVVYGNCMYGCICVCMYCMDKYF